MSENCKYIHLKRGPKNNKIGLDNDVFGYQHLFINHKLNSYFTENGKDS